VSWRLDGTRVNFCRKSRHPQPIPHFSYCPQFVFAPHDKQRASASFGREGTHRGRTADSPRGRTDQPARLPGPRPYDGVARQTREARAGASRDLCTARPRPPRRGSHACCLPSLFGRRGTRCGSGESVLLAGRTGENDPCCLRYQAGESPGLHLQSPPHSCRGSSSVLACGISAAADCHRPCHVRLRGCDRYRAPYPSGKRWKGCIRPFA
jgi:hypothetical protein